jgi:hypothetical protein
MRRAFACTRGRRCRVGWRSTWTWLTRSTSCILRRRAEGHRRKSARRPPPSSAIVVVWRPRLGSESSRVPRVRRRCRCGWHGSRASPHTRARHSSARDDLRRALRPAWVVAARRRPRSGLLWSADRLRRERAGRRQPPPGQGPGGRRGGASTVRTCSMANAGSSSPRRHAKSASSVYLSAVRIAAGPPLTARRTPVSRSVLPSRLNT